MDERCLKERSFQKEKQGGFQEANAYLRGLERNRMISFGLIKASLGPIVWSSSTLGVGGLVTLRTFEGRRKSNGKRRWIWQRSVG